MTEKTEKLSVLKALEVLLFIQDLSESARVFSNIGYNLEKVGLHEASLSLMKANIQILETLANLIKSYIDFAKENNVPFPPDLETKYNGIISMKTLTQKFLDDQETKRQQ